VGGAAAVQASLESAVQYSEQLQTADIVLVPLVLESANDRYICGGGESQLEAAVGQKHVALPGWFSRLKYITLYFLVFVLTCSSTSSSSSSSNAYDCTLSTAYRGTCLHRILLH
jgi:hypothetical protein